jgi:class 3 adenylate cyclase/predicted ATPase
VLFADVKGSMDLQEQLDPEEWHRIMDRFFQILTDGVHRFEGTVNQYTGDGIMALFGAPIAHEDHAQRACYSALRLSDELRRYSQELRREKGLNFSVRMGLNSGEVIVGKIGDDLRMDYTAQGHTVGLAARVEEIAAADQTYLTEHTAKLVEGYCRLGDLGQFNVKGVKDPLRVYELQGVGALRTRLEVSARRGLVRFVGRRGEMERLRGAWEAAQTGHGQIVGVVGEAGVGKSRLVYEFKTPLETSGRVLAAFSVSHGKAYAYLPLIDLLKSYFRITLEDDERGRREKVTGKVLTLDRTLEDTLPYLFSLLDIGDDASSLAQTDPPIRKRRTLEAVKRVLVRETLDQPCVLIFEDLHWVDAETQDFLEVMSESVATARLLLLVNYRPEYQHGWGSRTYYTQLRLDPLGEKESQELLTALLGEERSAERQALERLILEKTEGNPFFMEEVVQTLAEESVLSGQRGGYRLATSAVELHVPETVQGVLAARMDRLPAEEKALLQTLAVIGKDFPLGLLRRVVEREEEDLYSGLSHLQAGEFIYERPAFPEPEYIFKHALTQEVAYESLLGERRQVLHERTARAIEGLYADALDAHYGDLAHHYSRTENTSKAVEYLHLAGDQAVQRSAYTEAIKQLRRGVELVATLPQTRERMQREVQLHLTLGRALTATQGYIALEVEQSFLRARDLSEEVDEVHPLIGALSGVYQVYMVRAEHERAAEIAKRLIRLAEGTRDPLHLVTAQVSMGSSCYWRGEFSRARELLEAVIGRYDPREHGVLLQLWSSQDLGAAALGYLTWSLLDLGYPDQALTRSREALTLARELSHPLTQAFALMAAGRVHAWRGEHQAAVEEEEALMTVAKEHGFPFYVPFAAFLRVSFLAAQGQPQRVAEMRAALEAVRSTETLLGMPQFLALCADAERAQGQSEEGLALIVEAERTIAQTGESAYEAEVHRIGGELFLARSPSDEERAEASFRKALDIARRQDAKSQELRAATSLARLWQGQGRPEEARELLAPVYDWFTEGFDTKDLKDASVLLAELA